MKRTHLHIFTIICIALTINCFEATSQVRSGYSAGRKKVPLPRINTKRFYNARTVIKPNQIKINTLGLINRAHFQYERKINPIIAAGGDVMFYYSGSNRGSSRIDAFGKYFFKGRAPLGGYVTAGISQINFNNKEVFFHTSLNEPMVNNQLAYYKTQLVAYDYRNFSTYGGFIGVGFQNFIGRKKQLAIDYSFGYQAYHSPDRAKQGIVRNGIFYGRYNKNDNFNTMAFPLYTKFAVGYAF
jgi:hypothetical protein